MDLKAILPIVTRHDGNCKAAVWPVGFPRWARRCWIVHLRHGRRPGCDVTLGTRAHLIRSASFTRATSSMGRQYERHEMHLWAIMHRGAKKPGAKDRHHRPVPLQNGRAQRLVDSLRPGTDAALGVGHDGTSCWRDVFQDDDYLNRYCLGAGSLRSELCRVSSQ